MSMSKKIYGVVALLAAVAVFIAVFSISRIGRINEITQNLEDTAVRAVSLVRMNRILNQRALNTLRILNANNPEEIKELEEAELAATESEMDDTLQEYADNIPDNAPNIDDLKKNVEGLRDLWGKYVAAGKRVVEIARPTSDQEAMRVLQNECYPLRNAEVRLLMGSLAELEGIEKVKAWILMVPAYIRDIVMLSDEAERMRIKNRVEQIVGDLDRELRGLDFTAEQAGGEILRDWRELREVWAKHVEVANRVIALAQQNTNSRALALFAGPNADARSAISNRLVELVASATDTQRRDGAAAEAYGRNTRNLVTIVAIISIVAVGVLAWWLVSGIVLRLNRYIEELGTGADQVAAASGEISGASQSLAEGASTQAASLEETSSALEQMASMTRQNADNASKGNEAMQRAGQLVAEGSEMVERMTQSMGEITDSSEKISRIIKTIEEIAFQTNLLALNAAVEAARAGEAGKGFAVVADEVRNLAQRSAAAARDTSQLIEGTVSRVQSGSEIANQLSDSYKNIADSAGSVARLIQDVTTATNEQAQGVDQVNTAVAQMDRVTQQNAASAEECASASEQLSAQAISLQDVVGGLVSLVTGQAHAVGGAHSRYQAPSNPPRRPSGHAPAPARKAALPAPAGHGAQPPAVNRQRVMKPDEVIPLGDGGDFKDF